MCDRQWRVKKGYTIHYYIYKPSHKSVSRDNDKENIVKENRWTKMINQLSPRTVAALNHLRRLKPLDGYSAESYLSTSGKHFVRLKRRNVPFRDDDGFLDIVVHNSRVIGIQILTASGSVGRGILLVDEAGKPCNDNTQITVDMTNVLTTTFSSTAASSVRSSTNTAAHTNPPFSNNINNETILHYAAMAFAGLLFLKIIVNVFSSLAFLILPFMYFYACSNCPATDSFDAKKELKRVMRGAHLPKEQQPKGFFEQGLNRIAASIGTELATSLGYEVKVTDYFGVAKLSSVKVPVAGYEYYWIGIINRWQYVGQRELTTKND